MRNYILERWKFPRVTYVTIGMTGNSTCSLHTAKGTGDQL